MAKTISFSTRMVSGGSLSDMGINVALNSGFADLDAMAKGIKKNDKDAVIKASAQLGKEVAAASEGASTAQIRAIVGTAMALRASGLTLEDRDFALAVVKGYKATAAADEKGKFNPVASVAISQLRGAYEVDGQGLLKPTIDALRKAHEGFNGKKMPFENAFHKAVSTVKKTGKAITPAQLTEAIERKESVKSDAVTTTATKAEPLTLEQIVEQMAKTLVAETANMDDDAQVKRLVVELAKMVDAGRKEMKKAKATEAKDVVSKGKKAKG